jgi:hypothetical protein
MTAHRFREGFPYIEHIKEGLECCEHCCLFMVYPPVLMIVNPHLPSEFFYPLGIRITTD